MEGNFSNLPEKKDQSITEAKDQYNRYIRGYFYCVAMNEIIRGMSEEKIRQVMDLFRISCEFDAHNFHCCLTGLSERIYSSAYGLSPQEYVEIFIQIWRVLLAEFARCQYAADIFLETHCNMNKIAILFSPKSGDCISPEEMADRVSQIVQQEYQARIFKEKERHYNFTALSDRFSGFDDIRTAFIQAVKLSEFSFFFRSPTVVTESDIALRRKEVDYHSVMVVCMGLKLALVDGGKKECMVCLKELFGLLRDSLSFSLCRSALAYLGNLLEVFCVVYDAEDGIDPKKLCAIDSYDYLEDCYDAFSKAVDFIFAYVDGKTRYSGVVQTAMYYIKNNYKDDVCLHDIAKYSEITPSYLSGLFKREVGIAISEYVMSLRIEKAKKLLAESDKKVFQIAVEVGFHNIKYFGRAFRERVSMCPVSYRESVRQGKHPKRTEKPRPFFTAQMKSEIRRPKPRQC